MAFRSQINECQKEGAIDVSDFPYSLTPARIKEFFDKIPTSGTPDKVTIKELEQRGFKSSNDRSLLSILKFVGLIDENGTPTTAWTAYRSRATNRQVMNELVRAAYAELFQLYPDAQTRSDEELRDFVSTKTKAGERVQQAIVGTFKTLCSLADWPVNGEDGEGEPIGDSAAPPATNSTAKPPVVPEQKVGSPAVPTPGAVTVNFHLHLPDSASDEQIEAILAGVAKHILGRSE